jgi:hypothetical protein
MILGTTLASADKEADCNFQSDMYRYGCAQLGHFVPFGKRCHREWLRY